MPLAVASAADLRVLSAGAVKAVVLELKPTIESQAGRRLDVGTDTAGGLVRRGLAGEPFDVIIATTAGIDELERSGRILPASAVPVARVGIGAAVREGAAAAKIDTPDQFRSVLRAARAVAYIDPKSGGSSGIHIAALFERMDIAAEMSGKAVLVPGGLVADRLTDGSADLALQQMSELAGVPGIRVLGPIPAEYQNVTSYVGAVSSASSDPAAARAVLEALRSPLAKVAMGARGMSAP